MWQKISIFNECCSLELFIHQKKENEQKVSWIPQKCEAAQLFSAFIIIGNVYWAANQHIRMNSEGSCDTEDWRNDAENSALIIEMNNISKYIQIEKLF